MSQFIEMFGDQNTNDKQWAESLVKDEFKLSMGKTPARSNPECWENGTHKWISISDMAIYTRYTGDTSEYITDYAITDSGIKVVPKGTIIMSFKLSIGRTAITSEDIYTNEAIMAFTDFDKKKFNIDFLHFLIANKNWLLGAKQAVKGQTLNKESIGNAKIVIPPIALQEEFAQIYNQADKSEFVGCKSQFIEMFSGAPKVGINNLVDTVWGSSPDSKTYNDIGEGMPFYQGKTEFGDLYINAPVTYCTAPIKMAKANAILMSVRAPVGAVNIATQDCCIGRGLASITPKEGKSTTMFVYYALKYMEADIDRLGTGSTFKAINKESYAKIQMPNAKISEQAKFVSIAEQADKSEYYN